MKIELKNIKHFCALSDESNAFAAKLYVNDTFVAECSDAGKGGYMDIRPVNGQNQLLKEAENYCISLPPRKLMLGDSEVELKENLRLFIGKLISDDLHHKEFSKVVKRLEKNNIVYGKPGEIEYTWFWFLSKSGKKISIADMLSHPESLPTLLESITRIKKQGYTIYNTNIPKDIIDRASTA